MFAVLARLDHVFWVLYILNPHSSASELSLIVLAFAVFWFGTFYIIKSLIRPFVHNKPWLRAAVERDYKRSAKQVFQDLQINMTKVSKSKFPDSLKPPH